MSALQAFFRPLLAWSVEVVGYFEVIGHLFLSRGIRDSVFWFGQHSIWVLLKST